jgi:hypothetical protein
LEQGISAAERGHRLKVIAAQENGPSEACGSGHPGRQPVDSDMDMAEEFRSQCNVRRDRFLSVIAGRLAIVASVSSGTALNPLLIVCD